MLGSSIVRILKMFSYKKIFYPSSKELDLQNKRNLLDFLISNNIEYVFMAAAKVGGIQANINSPADFGYINGIINLNVIDSCKIANIKKLLFIGSSCIYPRECQQPMKEEYLLTGKFEPTNEMYSFSKAYAIKLCEAYNTQYGCNFITAQPCNLYGEGDHFDTENSHVISSLITKFHNAKINGSDKVIVWGDGSPRREFLYVDDCACACLFLMEQYNGHSMINVGTGTDISIYELAQLIKTITGFEGNIEFDTSKPNGMPRKLLDVSRLNSIGWKHTININEGLQKTYEYYKGIK
jgi:GDP-L-fucose synthase